MDLPQFLGLLSGVVQRNGYALAKCPAHDDERQSLSVSVGRDATILLKCHAGCGYQAICASLHIPPSDLFADAPDKRRRAPLHAVSNQIVAMYDYEDEDGRVLYQSVRLEPKRFFQRRPDPARPDAWLNSVEGVRRVLYKLPEIRSLR